MPRIQEVVSDENIFSHPTLNLFCSCDVAKFTNSIIMTCFTIFYFQVSEQRKREFKKLEEDRKLEEKKRKEEAEARSYSSLVSMFEKSFFIITGGEAEYAEMFNFLGWSTNWE
jgi:hypothetical protein